MTARGSFTPTECRESLRTSLRQLRTEHIDLFLMHEVLREQITSDLLQTLEGAVEAGLIGRFGIATSAAHAIAIAQTSRAGTVVQLPSNVFAPNAAEIPNHSLKSLTLRSVLISRPSITN